MFFILEKSKCRCGIILKKNPCRRTPLKSVERYNFTQYYLLTIPESNRYLITRVAEKLLSIIRPNVSARRIVNRDRNQNDVINTDRAAEYKLVKNKTARFIKGKKSTWFLFCFPKRVYNTYTLIVAETTEL